MASGNIDNLVSLADRTTEEVREIGKKGGIASGEARRQKKAMREMLEMCLQMKNKKGLTYQQLATMGLINGAIKGNAQNYKVILETLGELNPEEEKKNDGVLSELVEALKDVKKD